MKSAHTVVAESFYDYFGVCPFFFLFYGLVFRLRGTEDFELVFLHHRTIIVDRLPDGEPEIGMHQSDELIVISFYSLHCMA